MGLEVQVTRRTPCQLAGLIHKIQHAGLSATVVMVDNELVMPGSTLPADWREVRIRTHAGTVTLTKRSDLSISIVVFSNADTALRNAQQTIAKALEERS
jgi:hypothetical protein